MTAMCPVCNGLHALHAACPNCGSAASDDGRLNDFLGPYSPYRPIDDIGLTNGFLDVQYGRCIHVCHCPDCGFEFHRFVQEWPV